MVRFKMCFKMFMKIKDNRRKHSDFPWVVVLKLILFLIIIMMENSKCIVEMN